MTSKRRSFHPSTLRTPALAKANRLGEAMARAMAQNQGLAAPAMATTRKFAGGRMGSWSGSSQWQHGRVLSHAPQVQSPAWSYPSLPHAGAHIAHQGGVALLELMLVIGVVAIGTAGVMATYKVVDSNRKINNEVEHAITIAENVVATSAVAGDFHQINQVNALREGIFPADMLDDAGDPKNAWGGDVLLTATDVDGKPDWGTVLTFEGVPASACSKLATQAAAGFYAVSVNDENVRDNYGPIDVNALASLCTDNSRVQFTYAKHGGAGEYVDPDNMAPCVVTPPTTEVIVDLACPSGQLGDVSFRTDTVCYSPYGPPTDLPAVRVTPDTCTPKCVLPSPDTQEDIQTRTATQTLACPAGQSSTTGGNMGITQSRQEQRSSSRAASCPPSPGYSGPVGPYVWSAWTPFSSWLPTTPWATTANTCAPTCVAPPSTTETEPGTGTCATGRVTPGGATTYSRSRTRSVSYTCPGPTGAYDTVNGSWSAWSPAESVACAPKCVLPSPNPETNTETKTASQAFSCPSGQLITTPGPFQNQRSGTQTQTQRRTQTRTASCPTPTGAVAWTPWSAWSTWTGTTPWSPTFSCAPQCNAPAPTVQYIDGPDESLDTQYSAAGAPMTASGTPNTRSPAACVTGQYGLVNQTQSTTITHSTTKWRTGTKTRTTQRSRTVTYSCAAPTGGYTTTYGAYGPPGAPYGAWSPTTYGPYGAPTTPYGAWSAPGAPLGAWTTASTTCKTCPAPLTEVQQNPANPILYNATACVAGYYGYYGRSYNQHRERIRSYNCPAGTATLPSPDYTPYGAWINGPISTTSDHCTKCPTATTETGTQWVAYNSNNCPAGQYGYNKREREQSHTRTKSYTCPANTASLPPATYSGWTAWADTGTTRDVAGTNCVACPADKLVNQTQWVARSGACPNPYWTGTHTWQQQQTRSYYQNWNCPAGTATLPPVANDRFTPWVWATPIQNEVNCALPACGTTLETQARRYMAANQDLYNAYNGNWAGAKNHWNVYGYKEGRPGSCWAPPAQNCVVAASTLSRSWTVSRTCGPAYIPAGTYAHGAYVGVPFSKGNYKIGWTTGYAKYQCVNGVMSTTPYQPSCVFEPAEPTCPGCVPL